MDNTLNYTPSTGPLRLPFAAVEALWQGLDAAQRRLFRPTFPAMAVTERIAFPDQLPEQLHYTTMPSGAEQSPDIEHVSPPPAITQNGAAEKAPLAPKDTERILQSFVPATPATEASYTLAAEAAPVTTLPAGITMRVKEEKDPLAPNDTTRILPSLLPASEKAPLVPNDTTTILPTLFPANVMHSLSYVVTAGATVPVLLQQNERVASIRGKEDSGLMLPMDTTTTVQTMFSVHPASKSIDAIAGETAERRQPAGSMNLKEENLPLIPNPASLSVEQSWLMQAQHSLAAGGGGTVNNYQISFEHLIGTVNNTFEPGQTVQESDDFMRQLTDALQTFLNDTTNLL